MFDKVVKSVMDVVQDSFKELGIDLPYFYNSDLSLITEYTRSLQARLMYKQYNAQDTTIIAEEMMGELNKSNNIMLYNYTPLTKADGKFKNLNLEAYFKQEELPDFTKEEIKSGVAEQIRYLRDLNDNNLLKVRSMLFGKTSFNCKVLSSDTILLDAMMVEYAATIEGKRTVVVDLNFGDKIGSMSFDYNLTFNPIDTRQHIDYSRYGNIQEMSFTVNLEGIFLSYFTKTISPLQEVVFTTQLINS